MNAHVIFDGWLVQEAFWVASRKRPLGIRTLHSVRNRILDRMRLSSSNYPVVTSTFVHGVLPPVPDAEACPDFIRKAEAWREALDPGNLTFRTVRARIDFEPAEMVWHPQTKEYKQNPIKCDGAVANAIRSAKRGDILALSTVDGKYHIDPKTRERISIADAFAEAADKGVKTWLFRVPFPRADAVAEPPAHTRTHKGGLRL